MKIGESGLAGAAGPGSESPPRPPVAASSAATKEEAAAERDSAVAAPATRRRHLVGADACGLNQRSLSSRVTEGGGGRLLSRGTGPAARAACAGPGRR